MASATSRCALIAVPFLVPIVAMMGVTIRQNNAGIGVTQSEVSGLDAMRSVKRLVLQLGRHRDLAQRSPADPDRARLAAEIDDSFRAVVIDSTRLERAKAGWDSLKTAAPCADADFQRHDDVVQNVLAAAAHLSESSLLAYDAFPDTGPRRHAAVAQALPGLDEVGRVRSLATRTCNPFTAGGKLQLAVALGRMDANKAALEQTLQAVTHANGWKSTPDAEFTEYQAKADAFAVKVRASLEGVPPADLPAAGDEAVAALGRVYDTLDSQIGERLDARVAAYRTSNYAAVAAVMAVVALGLLAVRVVARGLTRQAEAGDESAVPLGRIPVLTR